LPDKEIEREIFERLSGFLEGRQGSSLPYEHRKWNVSDENEGDNGANL
jgi:hypothetical protein